MKSSFFLLICLAVVGLSQACGFWQDDWTNGIPCEHRLYPLWSQCCRRPTLSKCHIFYPQLWRFVKTSTSVSVSSETTVRSIRCGPSVVGFGNFGGLGFGGLGFGGLGFGGFGGTGAAAGAAAGGGTGGLTGIWGTGTGTGGMTGGIWRSGTGTGTFVGTGTGGLTGGLWRSGTGAGAVAGAGAGGFGGFGGLGGLWGGGGTGAVAGAGAGAGVFGPGFPFNFGRTCYY